MPRIERTRQTTPERFNPIAHVVLEPMTGPPVKPSAKQGAQPPRPQNAWILYRAWALSGLLEKQPELKGKPQSQISKLLGQQWANETPDVRKHFEHQANLQKERHAQEYPDYVFKPQKKEEKLRAREVEKKERARQRETEKLRKEIAKALRSGHIPQSITGIPEGGTGSKTHATADSALHNLAVINVDVLGPSPPMSACPSPDELIIDLPEEGAVSTAKASSDSAPQISEKDAQIAVASSSKKTLDAISELSPEAQSSSEQSSPREDPSWEFNASASKQDSGSSDALGLSQSLNAYLKQCFPVFDPDAPSNHLAMPTGNLVFEPGFIQDGTANDEDNTSCLLSMPEKNMLGSPDELADSTIANPFADSSILLPTLRPPPPTEDIFMQPFLRDANSENETMKAGRQVGNLLQEEKNAAANGERVIAAEHVPQGAPSMMIDDSDSSSNSNPSPRESSTVVSPEIPIPFTFPRIQPPDLLGSKDSMFNDFQFPTPTDGMVGIETWDEPFGLEADDGLSLRSPGPCGSNFRATLASLPMLSMDMEDEPHLVGGAFETGRKISEGRVPMGDIVDASGSAMQREDTNCLPTTLNEPTLS